VIEGDNALRAAKDLRGLLGADKNGAGADNLGEDEDEDELGDEEDEDDFEDEDDES
jgi:hypothetical protein